MPIPGVSTNLTSSNENVRISLNAVKKKNRRDFIFFLNQRERIKLLFAINKIFEKNLPKAVHYVKLCNFLNQKPLDLKIACYKDESAV